MENFFLHPRCRGYKLSMLLLSGINGVLEAYRACIPQVRLYGPTNFSPIIYHVCQFAAAAQREQGSKVRQCTERKGALVHSGEHVASEIHCLIKDGVLLLKDVWSALCNKRGVLNACLHQKIK